MPKMSKDTKIKRRMSELNAIYSKLSEKKRSIADPLIKNAAFMEVELEELRNIIAENGASEEYKNGENQYGRKASADLQSYNSLLKSYNMVNSRLEAMLPPEEEVDELAAFLDGDE
jgi:regulator of replication initiation timing